MQAWEAWAAGLFEGEGWASVTIDRRKPEGSASRQHPDFGLTMADEEIVRRFATIVGFGTVRPLGNKTGKPLWTWRSASKVDAHKITILLPWLSTRRQEQITRALTACTFAESRSESTKRGWVTRRTKGGG